MPFMRCLIRYSCVLAMWALCGASMAQSQFVFEPGVTPGFTVAEKGHYSNPTISDSLNSPTGKRVYFYTLGAWEFPVDCNTPGLYAVSLNLFVSSAPTVTLSITARADAATSDPYATRYTTSDTMGIPYTGEGVYQDFPYITDMNGYQVLLPLASGRNIIRIQNVTGLHRPATSYPTDVSATDNRPGYTGASSGFSVSMARVTLDRQSDLPTYGTITGTVSADKPVGATASDAIVTANPPGFATTEVNPWWKSGYWAKSRPDGTYSLRVPVGNQDVKAGRPSTYDPGGSAVVSVSVGTAAPAAANLTLPSMWHDDGTGHPTISVQSEYWDSHVNGMGFYTWDTHQNGLGILGYNGSAAGLALSYVVDAPATGLYRATQAWNWGRGDTNHTRLTTNLGSSAEMDLPDNKWAIQTKDYPDSIYLSKGRNVITTTVVSGDVGWDGLALTLTDEAPNLGTVQGTVTDSVSGQTVPGAVITIGDKTFTTDVTGKYQGLLGPGSYTGSATAPYADAAVPFSFTITAADIASSTPVTRDISIVIRPHTALTTANGYVWKGALNTGGAADFSAAGADESTFQPIAVPATWSSMSQPEQIYGWYRLHFDLPPTFLSGIPNRLATLRVAVQNSLSICEVDKVWLNGAAVGATGAFPDPPLDVQPADHFQPTDDNGLPPYYMVAPGMMTDAESPRAYYFPVSALKATDNVLAIKVYNNGTNDWIARPGGIVGIPTLEIAAPTGVVTGKVTSGGQGLANVRVAAMDDNAMASDWTMTDTGGNYTLSHVAVGSVTVGAARPGYAAVSTAAGTLSGAQTLSGMDLDLAAVPGGPAPMYDDFTDADWTPRWLAQSLNGNSGKDPTMAPIITIPGILPNTAETVPGTVNIANTMAGGTDGTAVTHWGALISKQRFSRWASVTAGKMVGLMQPTELDLFLLGSKDPDPANLTVRNIVGFDIRDNLSPISLYQTSVNGEPRLLWWIRNSDAPAAHPSMGAVPGNFTSALDITPDNPITFAMARVGSFWDLYLQGERVWGGNLPMPNFGDHRISASTWTSPSGQVWDWFRAGPTAVQPRGDLNGDLSVNSGDAIVALRIAGGLETAASGDVTIGDVTGSPGIGVDDALAILRAANGAPLP